MSLKGASGSASGEVALDVYRLVSIDPTSAPDDSGATDWLVYRIEQGSRVITGYRQGTAAGISAGVRDIVDALNARCMVRPKPGAPAAPPPRITAAVVPLRHKTLS